MLSFLYALSSLLYRKITKKLKKKKEEKQKWRASKSGAVGPPNEREPISLPSRGRRVVSDQVHIHKLFHLPPAK